MIEKAGFNIDKNVEIMSNIRVYICSKIKTYNHALQRILPCGKTAEFRC